jgi:8-oxo-dGTP diphosphatase
MKLRVTVVKFYDRFYIPDGKLIFSVITAKFKDKWIFVRHNGCSTLEIIGGHIEEGETSEEAAHRELMEESGAIRYNLGCVATYSVTEREETGYGRLYHAEVFELGLIPDISEIAEVILLHNLPEDLTYPSIQPELFNRTLEYLKLKKGV